MYWGDNMFRYFSLLLLLAAVLPLHGFKLPARIYPADCRVTLRFTPESAWAKKVYSAPNLRVYYMRDDRRFMDGGELRLQKWQRIKFRREAGTIVVDAELRSEHEHAFVFQYDPPEKKAKRPPKGVKPTKAEKKATAPEERCVAVYTLKPDLFTLRPFKGEFHRHSSVSHDATVSPEEHVRYARACGLDIFDVSDHWKYEQNARVKKTVDETGSGLSVYPGEEMHNHRGVLHSICIGGKRAMGVAERNEETMAACKSIFDELCRKFPHESKSELLSLAEALRLIRQARADGAVVIYCHPHWKPGYRFNSPLFFTRYLLSSGEVDAVEIANGDFLAPSNFTTNALLHDIAAETGRRLPVVSASDTHNVTKVDGVRRLYNIIFARDASFEEFKSALRGGRVVAANDCETRSHKHLRPIYFGTWRMVRLANFILDTGYWGRHDRLCAQQAALIAKYLAGDTSVVPGIKKLASEIAALRDSLYCTPAAK